MCFTERRGVPVHVDDYVTMIGTKGCRPRHFRGSHEALAGHTHIKKYRPQIVRHLRPSEHVMGKLITRTMPGLLTPLHFDVRELELGKMHVSW